LLRIIWEFRTPLALPLLRDALHDRRDNRWKGALDGLVALASSEAVQTIESAINAELTATNPNSEYIDWVREALEQAQEAHANSNANGSVQQITPVDLLEPPIRLSMDHVRYSEQLHSRYPSSERFVVNVRYSLVTLAAAVIAFIGAVVLVFASAPHGPSPGYAKAVPLILPFATVLAFGCVWFPCLLLASFWRRHRPLGLLVASGILFVPATYWVASQLYQDSQHRAARELAAGNMSPAEAFPLIDRYLLETQGGALYGSGQDFDVVLTLLHNPSTPAEVLARLATGLDESSPLWNDLAAHPNSPPGVIEHCREFPERAFWLARNPNASAELLEQLSQSSDFTVRSAVARNPNAPDSTLQRLASADLHGDIGRAARETLAQRHEPSTPKAQ